MGHNERDARTDDEVLDQHLWAQMDLRDDSDNVVWHGRICITGPDDIDRINEIAQPYLNVPLTKDAVYKLIAVLHDAGFPSRHAKDWIFQ